MQNEPDATRGLDASLAEVCERFRSLWSDGQGPNAEAFVAQWQASANNSSTPDNALSRGPLLQSLLMIELEMRATAGRPVARGDLIDRLAGDESLVDAVLAASDGFGHGTSTQFVTGGRDDRTVTMPPAAEGPTADDHGAGPRTPGTSQTLGDDRTATFDPEANEASGASLPHAANVPNVEGYEIVGKLGEGGMGAVWRAVQLSTRRPVALKFLGASAFGSNKAMLRFQREVELSARLDHPGIAQVYESGVTRGVHYYALQLVEGLPLDDYVQRQQLSPRAIAELMRKVCLAVEHAHQRGVIHRDLKPDNILVNSDGEPVVLDFGLAKSLMNDADGDSEAQHTLTQEGAIAGTPLYMAPEQAQGRVSDIDTRTDVYALGAVLYDLVARQPPFRGKSVWDTLSQIIERPPPAPTQHRSDIDRDLEVIILKALRKEPAERYASTGAFAEDLRRYLADEAIDARRQTAMERWRRWVRHHRAVAALLVMLVLGAIGVTVAAVAAALVYRDMANTQARLVTETKAAQQETRDNLYLAEMNLAGDAAASPNGAAQVRKLLAKWRPADGNDGERTPDLRGWEWYYLYALSVHERPSTPIIDARSNVFDVHESADGMLALALGGEVVLINTETQQVHGQWRAHDHVIASLRFSRDGKRLVTGSVDKTAKVWDTRTRRLLHRFDHPQGVGGVCFRPDGERVASHCGDSVVRVWDVSRSATSGDASGEARRESKPLLEIRDRVNGQPANLAYSPDGRWITGGGFAKAQDHPVVIWGADDGRVFRALHGLEETVRCVGFSPDGQRIVGTGYDGRILVWHIGSGLRYQRFTQQRGSVHSVVWSPDGKWIASGGDDFVVRLWDTQSGTVARLLRGHSGRVNTIAFSADSTFLTTGSADKTARIWDLEVQPAVARLSFSEASGMHPSGHVQWADGGNYLIATRSDRVGVWRSPRWIPVGGHTFPHKARLSRDGRYAIGFPPGDLSLMAIDSKGRASMLKPLGKTGGQWEGRCAWSTRDNRLAYSIGTELRLIDAADEDPQPRPVATMTDPGYVMAWTHDARTIVVGNGSGVIHLVDVADGGAGQNAGVVKQRTLKDIGRVIAVATHPTEPIAAIGGEGAFIWLVNTQTGEPLERFGGHTFNINGLDFSPDGKRLASASGDNTVRIWDVSRRAMTLTLRHDATVSSVAWRPDGKQLATLCNDGAVRVFDAADGYRRADQGEDMLGRSPEDRLEEDPNANH